MESAKLRALRAKNVLTCQRAFGAYLLMDLAFLRVHVATCLACLRAHVATCLACFRARDVRPCVSLVSMHACLYTHVVNVACKLTCFRDHVITCQHDLLH